MPRIIRPILSLPIFKAAWPVRLVAGVPLATARRSLRSFGDSVWGRGDGPPRRKRTGDED